MNSKSVNPQKIALITGASSGIGEALSRELIQRGWFVKGVARSKDKLMNIEKELGNSFMPIICDVSNKSNIEKASKQIYDQKIIPSIFFLNAGIAGEKVLENPKAFDIGMHEKIMAVNYFGVLSWVQYWEKPCQDNDGAKFIVTSSMNAVFAPATGSAYSASKAAISKAFESLSLTYLDTNLKFSVIYAGPVATEGLKGDVPFIWKPEKMAKYMANFALSSKSHGEPAPYYSIMCRLLRSLPYKWTQAILKRV